MAETLREFGELVAGPPVPRTRGQRIAFRAGWIAGFAGRLARGVLRIAVSALLLAVFASLCYWALVEIWRQIR